MKENAQYIAYKLESLAVNKDFYQHILKLKKQINDEQARKMCVYYDDAIKLVMNYAGTDVLARVQLILQNDIESSKDKIDISETYQKLLYTVKNYISKEKEKQELEK